MYSAIYKYITMYSAIYKYITMYSAIYKLHYYVQCYI